MNAARFDAVVVGGSVAGCASATLLARQGWRVALCEQKGLDPAHYKALCTHFIQPSAVPVLDALGLGHLREPDHAVRTQASFITPGGPIEVAQGYSGAQRYALNLERRVLDPALRQAAMQAGVQWLDGGQVLACEHQDSQISEGKDIGEDEPVHTIHLEDGRTLQAPLVVAADGRQSRLAKQLGNPTTTRDNQRAAIFAYFHGVPHPAQHHSRFILQDGEMAFVYPLVGGRTLISLYVRQDRLGAWRKGHQEMASFLAYCQSREGMPDLSAAVPETSFLGYLDYPNQIREPVHAGVAFVGDAALSLDPMSGVGCGFALTSAKLLVDAMQGRSGKLPGMAEELQAYATAWKDTIAPHAPGICADSLIGKDPKAQQQVYATISQDPHLAQSYLDLTGRLLSPAAFQRAYFMATLKRQSPKPKSEEATL